MKSDPKPATVSLGFGILGSSKAPTASGADERQSPAPRAKILLVDRDPESSRVMKYRLSTMYSVQAMGNAQSALTACAIGRPNLAIIGFPMTDTDGLAFLGELKSQWPQLVVIIVTAHGIIREAVQAIHRGAFGYLVKPVEREELLGQVQLALALSAAAADELAMSSRGERAKIPAYDEAREEFSRRYLAKTLQRAAGCVSHAARLAKRNRSDFYKLLARHRIHPQDYKPGGPERRPTGEEP